MSDWIKVNASFQSSTMRLGTLIRIGKKSVYIVVDDGEKWDALSPEDKRSQYRIWCGEGEKIGDQQGIH